MQTQCKVRNNPFPYFCYSLCFVCVFAINVIYFVNLVATSQKSTQSAGTSTNSNNPASLLKAKATSVGMILKPKRKSEYLVVLNIIYVIQSCYCSV